MHTNTDTNTHLHLAFLYDTHFSSVLPKNTHTNPFTKKYRHHTLKSYKTSITFSFSHTHTHTHTHTHAHTLVYLYFILHTHTHLFPVFRMLLWIKIDKSRRRLTDHSAHTSSSPSSRKSPLHLLSHFGAHLPFSSPGMAGDFLWWAVTHFKPLR